MNKQVINILISLGYAVIIASCATTNKEDVTQLIEEPIKEFDAPLTVDVLTESHLKAYEDQAASKLIELYNYLQMLSSPGLDSASKKHVKDLVKDLYRDSDSIAPFSGIAEASQYLIPFLEQLGKEQLEEYDFNVTNIRFVQGFEPISNVSQYTGKLGYDVTLNGTFAGSSEIKLLIMRVEKRFGDEKEQVWEVFFE